MATEALFEMLNTLYTAFDELVDRRPCPRPWCAVSLPPLSLPSFNLAISSMPVSYTLLQIFNALALWLFYVSNRMSSRM